MKRLAIVAATFLLVGQAQGETADQFDLVCDLTMDHKPTEPFVERYSIDLTAGLYCLPRECKTRRVHDVTATEIVLIGGGDQTVTISRVDGSYSGLISSAALGTRITIKSSGSCRRETFTPFPKTMF